MRYLLLMLLFLLPLPAFGQTFEVGHDGFASWWCSTEDKMVELVTAADGNVFSAVAASPDCYINELGVPATVTRFAGTFYDSRINVLVEIYEVAMPTEIGYVAVAVEGTES